MKAHGQKLGALDAPQSAGDAMLDALAEALAPRVAKLLREHAGDGDDRRARLKRVLASVGFELDEDGEPGARRTLAGSDVLCAMPCPSPARSTRSSCMPTVAARLSSIARA